MIQQRILGFDGLRAFAVVAVILQHIGFYSFLEKEKLIGASALPLVHGTTGVQIFFVLSGFLITKLLLQELAHTGSISLRDFYIRRCLRIFPVYYLVVGLTVLMHILGTGVMKWKSLPYVLTYTYNFIPQPAYSAILGHTWSLAVEEHFYLVWPLVFLLLVQRHSGALFVSALVFFFSSILIKLFADASGGLTRAYFVDRWTVVAGGYIAAGAALSLLLGRLPGNASWKRLLANPLSLVLGVLLFSNSVLSYEIFSGSKVLVLSAPVRGLGVCLVIGWIYLNQSSALVKILELRPLRYVGMISYGIYMWQGFFLSTGPGRKPDQTWPLDSGTGLALLIIVAPLSYHFFEKPILSLKRRFSWQIRAERNMPVVVQPAAT
jgi:peptidoglycan/LPS O-acetylase OafA/YrhL